jgi:hypothetical protein
MIGMKPAASLASKPTLVAALFVAARVPAFATCTSNVLGSHFFALGSLRD